MERADDDTWDITTSVGATAVMAAMARAAETNSADPLVRDPFAEPLVTTPQLAQVRAQVASWWTAPDAGRSDPRPVNLEALADYMAVRTHFFDAFFTSAGEAGIGQHVILAAGLDTRAYRLTWPADSVIYEIDLPEVLAYKTSTLNALGATPATRRAVGIDLRRDWPTALRDAGFDPTQPTAWLAEGLLPYLPADAQDTLFSHVDRLSAPGSQAAVEVAIKPSGLLVEEQQPGAEQQSPTLGAASAQRREDESFDPSRLWYLDEDNPLSCAEWFDSHGWTTQSVDSRQELTRLGRHKPTADDRPRPLIMSFITAALFARR